MEKRTPQGGVPALKKDKTEGGAPNVQGLPKTKYTNAKGAAQHLGLSKATFFRLRARGHFQPSPITGRYHLDDLDRETRATLSKPNGRDPADAQNQNPFGYSEPMPPLAHGESMSTQ